MTELGWLVGRRFQSLSRREYDWVAVFDEDATIVIECLWRLVGSDRIQVTSEDEGQQFGLRAPLDAAAEVNARIAQAVVEAVDVRQGLLDLAVHFSTGHSLQIVPNSSGYEAWNASNGNKQFIAGGGGELSLIDGVGRPSRSRKDPNGDEPSQAPPQNKPMTEPRVPLLPLPTQVPAVPEIPVPIRIPFRLPIPVFP